MDIAADLAVLRDRLREYCGRLRDVEWHVGRLPSRLESGGSPGSPSQYVPEVTDLPWLDWENMDRTYMKVRLTGKSEIGANQCWEAAKPDTKWTGCQLMTQFEGNGVEGVKFPEP